MLLADVVTSSSGVLVDKKVNQRFVINGFCVYGTVDRNDRVFQKIVLFLNHAPRNHCSKDLHLSVLLGSFKIRTKI